MFSVAPNIVLTPNMTQNAERKHRTQDTNTAPIRPRVRQSLPWGWSYLFLCRTIFFSLCLNELLLELECCVHHTSIEVHIACRANVQGHTFCFLYILSYHFLYTLECIISTIYRYDLNFFFLLDRTEHTKMCKLWLSVAGKTYLADGSTKQSLIFQCAALLLCLHRTSFLVCPELFSWNSLNSLNDGDSLEWLTLRHPQYGF